MVKYLYFKSPSQILIGDADPDKYARIEIDGGLHFIGASKPIGTVKSVLKEEPLYVFDWESMMPLEKLTIKHKIKNIFRTDRAKLKTNARINRISLERRHKIVVTKINKLEAKLKAFEKLGRWKRFAYFVWIRRWRINRKLLGHYPRLFYRGLLVREAKMAMRLRFLDEYIKEVISPMRVKECHAELTFRPPEAKMSPTLHKEISELNLIENMNKNEAGSWKLPKLKYVLLGIGVIAMLFVILVNAGVIKF